MSLVPLFDAGFDNDIVFIVLSISLIILIGFETQYKNSLKVNILEPDFWLLLFLFFALLSFFWSVYQIRTVIEWLQLLSYVLVFFLIRRISKSDVNSIIKISLITGSGIGILGILEYIFINTGRMVSTFYNPNPLATYLMMMLLFTLGISIRKDNNIYYIVSIIFGTSFILTGSRGGFLSFLIALPLVLIGIKRKKLLKSIIKGLIILSISLVTANIIIILAPIIQDIDSTKTLVSSITRIDSSVPLEVPKSISGRFEFWKVALKLFKHQPLRGFGLGTFFSAYYIEYSGNEWYSRFAHNHYLQTLIELGLVGLTLFITFLLISAKNIWFRIKSQKHDLMFAGSVAANFSFLLHILLEFSWNFPGATLTFFAFLGIAVGKMENHSYSRKLFRLTINYKVITIFLTLVLLLLSVHQFSISILKKGALLTEEDEDRALELVELGNSIYPINSVGYNIESKIYYNKYLENKEESCLYKSIKAGEKSINLTPYKWDMYMHIASIYLKTDDTISAEKYLKLSAEYSAYIITPYLELAKLYIETDENVKAKEILLKAIPLSEYTISKATKEEVPAKKIEVATLHKKLSDIYNLEKNVVKSKYHKEKEKELLAEAFNTINELLDK